MARPNYRKRRGVQYYAWHFCTNCSDWPTSDYDSRTTSPTTGELCDQCQAKERAGNCS
jgi:hypothetical protein